MVQQVEKRAAKHDNLSSVPEPHMVEGRQTPARCPDLSMCTVAHTFPSYLPTDRQMSNEEWVKPGR